MRVHGHCEFYPQIPEDSGLRTPPGKVPCSRNSPPTAFLPLLVGQKEERGAATWPVWWPLREACGSLQTGEKFETNSPQL